MHMMGICYFGGNVKYLRIDSCPLGWKDSMSIKKYFVFISTVIPYDRQIIGNILIMSNYVLEVFRWWANN